jgi:hypothetical protein
MINQCVLENGALVVNGRGGYAATPPISKTLKAKTLEAWVQLGSLDQQGGGVISIQDPSGDTFDAIVFAERESRRWMAGSEGFGRTQSFGGEPEAGALDKPVHVAISYADDGTISGYRNGQPYGKPYKSNGPHTFEAGKAQILFGNRHGEPSGNKNLTGRIYRARLYDRALTPEEVAASAADEVDFVSAAERVAALNESERNETRRLEAQVARGEQDLAAAQRKAGSPNEWASLGHALFNLKEFIYIR